jgi:GNAT superfamily N-acetyltransferase
VGFCFARDAGGAPDSSNEFRPRYGRAMSVIASIRFAAPEEGQALDALHRRSSFVWEEDRASLQAHPDALGVPRERIASRGVRVAVGESGALLGFSGVADAGGSVCQLEDLFVEPAWMRRGIGRALVEDVATRYAEAGFASIAVVAAPRTFAFYESVGFTVGEPHPTRFGMAARLCRDLWTDPDRDGERLSNPGAGR